MQHTSRNLSVSHYDSSWLLARYNSTLEMTETLSSIGLRREGDWAWNDDTGESGGTLGWV